MRTRNESGIALVGVLLILVLLGVLIEGFIISINSDQGLISTNRQENQAFYGALAGLEALTANLGRLFETTYRPSVTQISALDDEAPVLSNISFESPGGSSGYQIAFETDTNGTPVEMRRTISSGPYEGLVGLITPYTMTVTARAPGSAEVRLQRSLNTILVPVFQFGIFSQSDLSFYAGADFEFGGRVHTNGNLYLNQSYNWLTMSDRVTAAGEVIRTHLNNRYSMASLPGRVRVAKTASTSYTSCPSCFRELAESEGSLTGDVGSALNDPTWTNLSIGTYNGYIRNGRTGATIMNLPLVNDGAQPIDLIRRPATGEGSGSNVFKQRYFSMASMRILLSDTPGDITSLPTVTSTAPISLGAGSPYTVALSPGNSADSDFTTVAGTPLIDGYIKIEIQTAEDVWTDVTSEILNFGISGIDLPSTTGGFSTCGYSATSIANSIIRVQRYKDSPAGTCGTSIATEFWPNTLYDTREGIYREKSSGYPTTGMYLGGVMHYVELDIQNLARWFTGVIGTSGTNAIHDTGYVVYFSDRRTNRDAANQETGEYGFEDVINPLTSSGASNGLLDEGEDANDNSNLDLYGATPQLPASPYDTVFAPLDSSATPATYGGVTALVARKNRPIFFRRALKLIRGSSINLGNDGTTPYGLTVSSENPVYVHGNYNASGSTFGGSHVASAVIADAVTLLSDSWNDRVAFNCPFSCTSCRNASTTYYRMAIISGKSKSFTYQTWFPYYDFGTDGGAHNFLRMLENWGGQTLYYRGSIVSLFFSRQGLGSFKCGYNVIYSPPSRGYKFDVEFLDPDLLPPKTPMFRDVNITGFTRTIAPSN
ncbi:MAG: hypothetical protein JXA73_05965 [Acidobacteria bacterium]|nr:hypothetical protein [Acidobacteriota bacterium]